MRKICSFLVVAVVLSAALISCGPSPAKVKAVQDAYAGLVNLVNETTVLIEAARDLDIIDNDVIDEYNTLVDVVNELGEIELDKASNAELDSVLESINQMKTDVSALKGVYQGVLL
ncbi:MAG: hypothetical protein FWH18_09230 [Marinilabiliaceae bacterium]|nr:hypothetical protein [Marinilabiliaceae bacterium]